MFSNNFLFLAFKNAFIFLITKIRASRYWYCYIITITILLSEIFTLILNIIQSLLWWGRIDTDLLMMGFIDAFVVSLFVGIVAIVIIRYTFRVETLYNELQKQMEESIKMENEKLILQEKLNQAKRMESLATSCWWGCS